VQSVAWKHSSPGPKWPVLCRVGRCSVSLDWIVVYIGLLLVCSLVASLFSSSKSFQSFTELVEITIMLVTFRVRHSRGEMYIGHGQMCVCLSLAAFPYYSHYCTDPDVSWGNGRGCPLVVHYWVDFQSVHGFHESESEVGKTRYSSVWKDAGDNDTVSI